MSKFLITKNYLTGSGCEYLCVLTDFTWWAHNITDLREWCGEHGCIYEGMTVLLPDDRTSTLFTLRWM